MKKFKVTTSVHCSSMGETSCFTVFNENGQQCDPELPAHSTLYGIDLLSLLDLGPRKDAEIEITVKLLKKGQEVKNPWR